MNIWNRRNFLRAAGATSAVTLMPGVHLLGETETALEQAAQAPVAANDHIQIALIGAGGQGMYDTGRASQVPGVKLVAVADCYDGRLTRSQGDCGATTSLRRATTTRSWRARTSTR